jgi:hypothetical protein
MTVDAMTAQTIADIGVGIFGRILRVYVGPDLSASSSMVEAPGLTPDVL